MDSERQIDEAFTDFRRTLAAALTERAQQTVDETVSGFSLRDGPFQLRSARVQVVISDLEVVWSAQPERPSTSPPARRSAPARKRKPTRRPADGRRGRPVGPVRAGLLSVFSAKQGATLTTNELRDRLEQDGVSASADSVHQQLRRLVQNGTLERTGRGEYRLAAVDPTSA